MNHIFIEGDIGRLHLQQFRKIVSQPAYHHRRVKDLKMPRNLRNQHNGRERCTDHGHQKSRHGNKHDITDILLPDDTVPHSYQTDNLSQQPSRNQRRNETAARQSGRDREN